MRTKAPEPPQVTGDTAVAPEDSDADLGDDLEDESGSQPEASSPEEVPEPASAVAEPGTDQPSEDNPLGRKQHDFQPVDDVEDEDTADDIAAFGRNGDADHASATEVPGQREHHPEAVMATPAPAPRPSSASGEEGSVPMTAWVAGGIALVVLAAVVGYAVF